MLVRLRLDKQEEIEIEAIDADGFTYDKILVAADAQKKKLRVKPS